MQYFENKVHFHSLQCVKMMVVKLFDHLCHTLGTLVVMMHACSLNEPVVEGLGNHRLWELTKISLDQVRNNMGLIHAEINIANICNGRQ